MPEANLPPMRWRAYEHEHFERGGDWFWALGIIAVSAALTSILFDDVLFGLLIVLAAVVIGMLARRPPTLHEFELTNRGIKVGDTMHSYDEVISFWVEEEGERPTLLVDTIKFMSPNLIIPLEGVDPVHVRAFLRERAHEVPMQESFAHKILEFFGL